MQALSRRPRRALQHTRRASCDRWRRQLAMLAATIVSRRVRQRLARVRGYAILCLRIGYGRKQFMSSTIVRSDAIATPDRSAARGEAEGGERKRPVPDRAGRAGAGSARAAGHDAQGAGRRRPDVSERHLANLEYGVGNASILVLLQVTRALHCSFAELLGDVTTLSPEWLLLREMLENRDEATLRRVRVAVGELLGTGAQAPGRAPGRRGSRSSASGAPASRRSGGCWRRTSISRSSSSPAKSRRWRAARPRKSSAFMARTPTAATSVARSRRRCRSIRRR